MNAVDLVKDVNKLVSLPEVCTRLHDLIESRTHTVHDMAELIMQDPDLSARLLKISNSSMYGFRGRIGSIDRAITVVGTSELLVLVLATSSIMTFKNIPSELFNMASYWRHSVYCGVVAKVLAKHCNVLHPQRLFLAGLLHDIGLLALCYCEPELAKQVFDKTRDEKIDIYEAEQEILGFDHADIGRELLLQWGLPENLPEAVYWQHHLTKTDIPSLDACIVHLAVEYTHVLEKTDEDGPPQHIEPIAWKMTKLDPSRMDMMLLEAAPEFEEALGIIIPNVYS